MDGLWNRFEHLGNLITLRLTLIIENTQSVFIILQNSSRFHCILLFWWTSIVSFHYQKCLGKLEIQQKKIKESKLATAAHSSNEHSRISWPMLNPVPKSIFFNDHLNFGTLFNLSFCQLEGTYATWNWSDACSCRYWYMSLLAHEQITYLLM